MASGLAEQIDKDASLATLANMFRNLDTCVKLVDSLKGCKDTDTFLGQDRLDDIREAADLSRMRWHRTLQSKMGDMVHELDK